MTETMLKDSNTSVVDWEIETQLLPVVNVSELLWSSKVQWIISSELKKNEASWLQLKSFIEDALKRMFTESNTQSSQIRKIFSEVLELDKVKASTLKLLDDDKIAENVAVKQWVKWIEKELSQVKPMLEIAKNALEWTGWLLSKIRTSILWDNSLTLAKNSLQWLKWRVANLDIIFDNARKTQIRDEEELSEIMPMVAYRITRMEAILSVFEALLEKTPNKLIYTLRDELLKNVVSQKTYLRQMVVMAGMTAESWIIIETTEFQVHSRLNPLIEMLKVWANAKWVREMQHKTEEMFDMMEKEVTRNIDEINRLDLEYKNNLKTSIDNAFVSIDTLIASQKQQVLNMWMAQDLLNKSLPAIKEKLQTLDSQTLESINELNDYQKEANSVISLLEKKN